AATRYGADYVAVVAPHVQPFAMIESRAGLAAVAEIAAVDGLAGLYVGTSDLSLDLGFGPRFDPARPEMAAALTRIEDAARQQGKIPAIHVVEPGHVAVVAAMGYRHILLANDFRLLLQGAGLALDALRAAVGR
ncbi:MAG: aldolase/citrate lyase family protein, partial [Zavarzinia sp.]|nr:aldolase/citrate lyase family protein [Zavarzinia sp.]